MSESAFYIVIVLGVILEAGVAIWCVWDTRRHYNRRQIGNVVYDRLSYGDTRTAIAAALLMVLAIHSAIRLINPTWPSIAPWGTVMLFVALGLLLWGPIATWQMLRHIARSQS